MKYNRWVVKGTGIVLAGMLVMGLAGGCGSKRTTEMNTYRQYGINCLESGKYEEAITSFQKALDQSLGHIGEEELDICFYKARAQYLGGDVAGATETYTSIIAYNKDARAYYLRGNLYFDLGDREQAEKDYKAAVARDKGSYEMYLGIYQTYANNNAAEDGKGYLEDALKLKGDKPKDCLYKGRVYYLLGKYEDAVENLKKAQEGKEPQAAYYLGQAYEAQGDDANAKKCIDAYISSGVATSYDLCELGAEEMADADYEQALVYFTAGLAMEKVPNKQSLMKNAIAAYEYSGDFKSAKKMMEDYVSQYPSDEDAVRESTFLETR